MFCRQNFFFKTMVVHKTISNWHAHDENVNQRSTAEGIHQVYVLKRVQ